MGWKVLGEFTVASNVLTVQLSDHANSFVIADAVRIERVADAAAGEPGPSLPAAAGTPASTVKHISPLYNVVLPPDVNRDEGITPLDALIVISQLNASGSSATAVDETSVSGDAADTQFSDVNGGVQLTASDVLTVINVLNALGGETAAGEGEAALAAIPAPLAQPSAAPLPSPAPAFDAPLRTAGPAAAATAEPDWPGPVEAPPAASLAEARTPHEELDWTSLDLVDVLPDLARDVADSWSRAEKEGGSGHPYSPLVRFGRFG